MSISVFFTCYVLIFFLIGIGNVKFIHETNFVLYRFKYVVPIDTDEVIVPRIHKNWIEMLENITFGMDADVYSFRNIYFFEDVALKMRGKYFENIPEYLYMLQNVYRSGNHTPPGKK